MTSGFRRQRVAAAAALLSVVSSGACFGWVTPILDDLLGPDSEVTMTNPQSSWMIAVIEVGTLVTPIPAGMAADRWGRKPCILATGPLFFLSWMIVLTTSSVQVLYLVRILQGAITGCVLTVVPVYLAEISSPSIRGATTSCVMTAWYIGYLFEYCLGPLLSYRVFVAVTATWPLLQTLFVFQPESPYFLLMKGLNEDAHRSLSVLRMASFKDQSIADELLDITNSLRCKEKSPWVNLINSPSDRSNLLVVCVVGFVMMMSGGNALMSYSSHLFSGTHIGYINPNCVTAILGLILFLASLFSSASVDKAGRRPLLLISTIGCTVSQSLSTIFFYFQEVKGHFASPYYILLISSVVCYFVFWAFGLVPVYVTYQSELFSSTTRGTASSLIALFVTICAFINLKTFSPVAEGFGYWALFGLYTCVSFIGIISVYVLAPETKGKSLSEIQKDNSI